MPSRSSSGVWAASQAPVSLRRAPTFVTSFEVVRVRVERVVDQFVDDVGAVVLRGVDVVDTEFDRAAYHGAGRFWIGRRSEYVRACQLHRAEADAV